MKRIMSMNRYFLSDFVSVQRQSFFDLLEKGLIEEFGKRTNPPITNKKNEYSFFFYPEYYILTKPQYKPNEAILKNKSYTSKLFVPVQITNKKKRKMVFKWVYIGNIPLMTKRGHFILNGAARVIVNQILRSPGVYYQEKLYENYDDNKSSNTDKKTDSSAEQNALLKKDETPPLQPENLYKRYYCDLICMRGSWLRIEMDKEKNIWAQMKKGPKIPMYWFLLAMGLSEKVIMKSVMDSKKLIGNLETIKKPVLGSDRDGDINTTTDIRKASPLPTSKNSAVTSLETGFTLDSTANESINKEKDSTKTPRFLAETKFSRETLSSLNDNFNRVNSEDSTPFLKSKDIYVNGFEGKLSDPEVFNDESRMSTSFSDDKINTQISTLFDEQAENTFEKPVGTASSPILEGDVKKSDEKVRSSKERPASKKPKYGYIKNPPEAWEQIYKLLVKSAPGERSSEKNSTSSSKKEKKEKKNLTELGRQWLYNRFMNPRSYDLGKQGRLALNKKLGLTIASNQLTLTGLDVLYATDYLIKVEKGLRDIDDIDHLKNRRVRTSGELIQIQIGVGLVRLEKYMRNSETLFSNLDNSSFSNVNQVAREKHLGVQSEHTDETDFLSTKFNARSPWRTAQSNDTTDNTINGTGLAQPKTREVRAILSGPAIINNKAFNSAIREFFGTSPLSQFMDQINPLAELTHKRRLSSMGPGGVTRDTATLAIRGIHPTHYGRICPIETPEGKNTGLVNSMTTYARVNSDGILESPFYKVYKGQVQKNAGMYYLNSEQEEKIKLAASDLYVSPLGFLPKGFLPVRLAERFTKIPRSAIEYIGVSPLQMISIAASLIPFLEHDDANRALMGSNMQRQAVPLIRPERPIVGTGLEGRTVSDSGHILQAKVSGLVTYVSSRKIIVEGEFVEPYVVD